MAGITTLFWDIGGVLISNGWDTASRRETAEKFGFDWEDFQDRHQLLDPHLEKGSITLDEYLEDTVFHRPRDFSLADLRDHVLGCSRPLADSALPIVEELAAGGRYFMATLNNEGRQLNEHRIETFKLDRWFRVFFSSCYLGVAKPEPTIYRIALEVTHHDPAGCVFIDDRALNLECAARLGMRTIHYTGSAALRQSLLQLGVET